MANYLKVCQIALAVLQLYPCLPYGVHAEPMTTSEINALRASMMAARDALPAHSAIV